MDAELQRAQVVATLSNVLTPAGLMKDLGAVTDFDTLKIYFDRSGEVAIGAILLRAIAAGRAHELAGHGDGITKQLASDLGISERQTERYVRIYHEIIKPRIARDGDAAQFYLEEKAFYDTACEAAPIVKLPAAELIEQAEERRAGDAKFSANRWRKELGLSGDEGSTVAPDRAVVRWLKKVEKFDITGADFAQNADREILDSARDALVFTREIVEALEGRFGGRTEQ